ncbi:unnamed protein product [Dimorphilus gyrociliatus]|uniref:Uncharacterized protein n=1 Tax=Dimorphilus gyrociliatus TaxID=2664684 RepID=A0A7I8V8C1_9ANNE|nr:unnamed protein product [Dimorphilus gyrociliatus]
MAEHFKHIILLIIAKYIVWHKYLLGCVELFFKSTLGIKFYKVSYENWKLSLSKEAQAILRNEDHVRKGFQVLFSDLQKNSELSSVGYRNILKDMTNGLENKASIRTAVKADPKLAKTKFKSPVIILTLARTGSTFINCLLAKDKRWKAPELWELLRTTPIREEPLSIENKALLETYETSFAVHRLASNKNLFKIHSVGPTDPDDFLAFLIGEGLYVQSQRILKLPNYSKYINDLSHDTFVKIYKNIKLNLSVLAAHQNMENKRFLLIQHLGPSVNALAMLNVFPDAQLITLHRDLCKIIPSMTSLYSYLGEHYLKPHYNNTQEICDRLTESYVSSIEKMMKWRNDPLIKKAPFKRVIDINFEDLVKDSKKVIRELYRDIKMEYNDECNEIFENYINKQQDHKHGIHNYQKMLLDKEAIRQRTEDYVKKFHVKIY